jgi:hypothetical protein
MSKPLLLLLPYAADFRWLRGRADSPWYPTARLYRQPRFGDWDNVVREVRQDVAQLGKCAGRAERGAGTDLTPRRRKEFIERRNAPGLFQ